MSETDMTAYERRRNLLLHREAGREFSEEIYGGVTLARLAVGKDREAANANLRHVAEWFEHPHPKGRDHRGECDFTALKLARAYYQFRDVLEPGTLEAIRRFFLTRDFSSIYMSENHYVIFRVSRYLMAQTLPDETFRAYGRTGGELLAEDGAVLRRFLRFRAECGWGEFDSAHYLEADWKCLCSLFDFTRDPVLKRHTEAMLNLLLTDMAVDSLDGMYCGAHGRIYPRGAIDHVATGAYAFQHLYFGQGDPALVQSCLVEALLSSFRPDPLVLDVALHRREPYENRERKHLHNVNDLLPSDPLEGSIRKYTWWTPGYVLGCVQHQDDYPEEDCLEGNPAGWYAHHQQHQWDLTFAGGTRARIFTHHPGTDGEHNYWTGDRGCGCGLFFQSKSALLALYEIAPDQPLQFIHAYVPKSAFDEVVEENGFIFVRKGEAYGALKLMSGYEWTTAGEWKDVEIKSPGARHAVICEAGASGEFGSFKEFRREMLSNRIKVETNPFQIFYHSKRNGKMLLRADGNRELEGMPVPLDYATYDSPYLHSDWKSGIVKLTDGTERREWDFSSLK